MQKNELKTVEHVFVNEDDYITTLELFDPETRRNETITTTPEHPFYVSSKEKEPWTGAGELEVDDEIRKADGNVGIVLFVRTKLEKKVMYNLSVSDNHNFFVGDNKWLTHNISCPSHYSIDDTGMSRHKTGKFMNSKGEFKSQFLFGIDAEQAVIDAAKYADNNALWSNGKAKVFIKNGPIGILGESGEKTQWINVYRKQLKDGTWKIHGAPGSPPRP